MRLLKTQRVMIRKDMWSVTLPASALQLDQMKYTVSVPILGPCGHGCSVEKEILDGTIRVRHTSCWHGCETEAVIEMPDDAVSECSVEHTCNIMTVSVKHRLHSRWWDGVVALCIVAEDGDGVVWDKAWTTLERVALEKDVKSVRERAKVLMETTPLPADVATTIAERACLAEDGWMQGGAMFALHFAHAAMDCEQPAPGALGRLEQVLTSGGLTRGGVVAACMYGLARTRRGPGWVEHEVEREATVHEAVVRCTGMSADELLSDAHIFAFGPLALPESAEERAAIKARVLHGHVRETS